MEWYWWVLIVLAAVVLLRKLLRKPQASGTSELEDLRRMAIQRQAAAAEPEQPRLNPLLKPFVARLYKVHATVGSFASQDTRTIGQEILDRHGYFSMVAVCDEVRKVLGGGPARDLEYKWNGIGDWRG